MLNALRSLKGKDRYETAENYSIAGVLAGAALFAAGVGLTIASPAGIPTIVAMLGAIVAFASSVAMVFTWLAKDLFGKEA